MSPDHRILIGDCLTLMPQMRDASIDMILADLPYGTTQNAWDIPLSFEPMWQQFHRVAKPHAPILLMAAQPFASQLICSNLKNFRYDLIWRKNKPTGFLNAKRQPLRAHEHVLVFYREPPTYNPQKTQGHAPGNYARRTKHSTNYGARPQPSMVAAPSATPPACSTSRSSTTTRPTSPTRPRSPSL